MNTKQLILLDDGISLELDDENVTVFHEQRPLVVDDNTKNYLIGVMARRIIELEQEFHELADTHPDLKRDVH